MLYEVITYPRIYALLARHAGFDSALLVRGVEGGVIPGLNQTGKVFRYLDRGDVITSYSIHYTKLYDRAAGRRRARLRCASC